MTYRFDIVLSMFKCLVSVVNPVSILNIILRSFRDVEASFKLNQRQLNFFFRFFKKTQQ